MKKILCSIIVTMLFMFGLIGPFSSKAEAKEIEVDDQLYTSTLYTYHKDSNYNGLPLSNRFSASNLGVLNVDDSGGTHIDGNGNEVYSNYVQVSIAFNISDSLKVYDSDYRVIKSLEKYVDKKWINDIGMYRFPNAVGKGAVLISRANASGEREVENPFYLDGNSHINAIRFTEDGDYYIDVFFLLFNEKTLDTIKCVLEFKLSIRTKVYIKDVATGYDVRNSYAYYEPVRIDSMNRSNVYYKVNGHNAGPETILSNYGKYEIEVYGNGFLAERFSYEIFSLNDDMAQPLRVYFDNIRKELRDYATDSNGNEYAVYEAESFFTVKWYSKFSENDIVATYTYAQENEKTFSNGHTFEEIGLYLIKIEIKSIQRTYQYFVYIAANDYPEVNYNKLSANRFNNFMTKWYEIYDEVADDYLCFSMNEYSRAINAALSLENDTVIDKGYEFIYRDEVYSSKSELTPILIDNAEKRIKIKYFDYEENIEKIFSPQMFEEIIYLNSEFMFVTGHKSDVYSVELINENDEVFKISFFKKLSDYNLPEGVYKVSEKDFYGNETVYNAYIDKSSPKVSISINDEESIEVENNQIINCRYFKIVDLLDDFDDWAVVRINQEYFLDDELDQAIFTDPGQYNISAYDRNNNITKFTVNISNDKLYTLIQNDDLYTVNLKPGVLVSDVFLNGELVEIKELTFNQTNKKQNYVIYLVDETGKKDCVKLDISANESLVEKGDVQGNEEAYKLNIPSWLVTVMTFIPLILIAIPGLIYFIYVIEEE